MDYSVTLRTLRAMPPRMAVEYADQIYDDLYRIHTMRQRAAQEG